MPKGRPQDYNVYGKASAGVKPSVQGSRATGTAASAAGRARRPATTCKPAVPGSQRSATASARNKQQRGIAMRNAKAAGRGRT